MAAATSASEPKRPSGIMDFILSFSSCGSGAVMGVSMKPGATAFTVMLREATSTAMARVRPISLAGVAGLRDYRADINDAAGALLEHRAESLLNAEMRAGEVGAQHSVPVFELHAQGESVAGDGGVVHQNVELAEFRENLLEGGFYLRGIGYVQWHGQRAAACGFDFGVESR